MSNDNTVMLVQRKPKDFRKVLVATYYCRLVSLSKCINVLVCAPSQPTITDVYGIITKPFQWLGYRSVQIFIDDDFIHGGPLQ